jgi:hypothetical protein
MGHRAGRQPAQCRCPRQLSAAEDEQHDKSGQARHEHLRDRQRGQEQAGDDGQASAQAKQPGELADRGSASAAGQLRQAPAGKRQAD